MGKGCIQVYTGNGKGKTTAALGLGLRAVGRGLRVVMVQFLKGRDTGELESIKKLAPEFTIIRFGETKKFINELDHKERKEIKKRLKKEMQELDKYLGNDACHVLILDEIMAAIHGGFLSEKDVCKIIDNRPPGVELVLTGRNAPDSITKRADLITEMREVKHYIHDGLPARRGIEF